MQCFPDILYIARRHPTKLSEAYPLPYYMQVCLEEVADLDQRTTCSYRLLRAFISFLVILYIFGHIIDFATFVHPCIIILVRICCLPLVRQSWYPAMYVSLSCQFDVHLRCDNPTLVGMLTQIHFYPCLCISCVIMILVELRMDLGGMCACGE